MNLPKTAINRPVLVSVLFMTLAVLGAYAAFQLNVTLMPDVDFPFVTIKTLYPGAGPDQIETLISKPLEDVLSTTNNLKDMWSVSMEGVSIVICEFNMDVSSEVAAADVREKVSSIRGQLPDDAKEPEILKLDINAIPILYVGFSGPDLKSVYQQAKDDIKPILQTVRGVGNIDIVGGLKREIRVEVQPDKLKYYGIDLLDVANRLKSENINMPSGHFTREDFEISGRLDSEFTNVSEIGSTEIPVMDQRTGQTRKVNLSSLAQVRDTYAEVRDSARVNGKDAVALIIQKQPDANTIEVVDEIRYKISEIMKRLPPGYELTVVVDYSTFIRESVADVRSNLFLGVIITGLVLFLFLRTLGSTLIVLITIPVALIGTMFFMYMADFSFNVLTLSSLALCVGVLIDSSIVILENIYRHKTELKKNLRQAAEEATLEVAPAVIASISTNIVVFLPIAFMSGIAGKFFKEFGLVQVFATILALCVGFTLIPMLASKFMKTTGESHISKKWDTGFSRMKEGYKKRLLKVLKRPKLVFGLVILLLLASFSLVPIIGTEFATPTDQGISSITVRMPPGTNFNKTESVVSQIEDRLRKIPELDKTFTTVGNVSGGEIGAGSEGPEYAQIVINWKDKRKRSAVELMKDIKPFLASLSGATITVQAIVSEVGGGGAPIEYYITAPEHEILSNSVGEILEILQNTPGVTNADSTYHPGKPEINFEVKRSRLAALDLDPNSVALNVRAALEGLTPTTFREGDNEYDIRVTIPEELKKQREVLENLPITNKMKDLFILKQLADVEESSGPTIKERYNRQPSITVNANTNKPVGTVANDFIQRIKGASLPADVHLETGGDVRIMKETFRDIGIAISIAVILVYLVMAAQFESWVEPFIIIGSLPLAIIGILFGLFIFGKTINMFSLLGVVILTGIGVNNGILIINFAKTLIDEGKEPLDAIVEAGSIRFRPCLMTTLTTIAAMIPLAFGVGKATAFKSPMGVTVISGAFSALVLTLFVIPLLYFLYLRRKKRRAS
jgi:HAE1 family hydrophobic/amphiphilic exporter-1